MKREASSFILALVMSLALLLRPAFAADFLQDPAVGGEGGQYALWNATIGGFTDARISSPEPRPLAERGTSRPPAVPAPPPSPSGNACTWGQIVTVRFRDLV